MKNSIQILNKMRKHFPQVNKVVDATESIAISVKPQDSVGGRRKEPGSCALAKACMREEKADGALINIGFSYIINGEVATRYKTSAGVGREITSFDRHGDFAPGTDYVLSKVSKGNCLGTKKSGPSGPKSGHQRSQPSATRHQTVRIRKVTKK